MGPRGKILVAAALLALVATERHATAQTRCTATARVSGAPALVERIVGLLRERGVPLGGTSDCGALTAVVAAEEERIRITIIDADGKTVERVVDDVEAAATAVESWARGDLLDPLLAAREGPVAPAVAAPDRERPPAIHIETVPPAPRGIDLTALADSAVSHDGALWTGVRGQGCIHVGPICAGVLARLAFDVERGGDAAEVQSSRRELDLLFLGEVPLRLARGRFALSPGLAVGQSSIRAHREESCDQCVDDDVALLLRAHVGASARMSDAWSARLDLGFGYSPWARTQIGEIDHDLDDEPHLAGSTRWQAGLGLGLTYEGL